MNTMASDNGREGFKLSDDPFVLKLQLQVLQMQMRREDKAAFANAATPSPTVKKLKPLHTLTPARTMSLDTQKFVLCGAAAGDPARRDLS